MHILVDEVRFTKTLRIVVRFLVTVASMLSSSPRLTSRFASSLPAMCAPWSPVPFSDATLLLLNEPLSRELGIDPGWLRTENGLRFLLGEELPEDAFPVSQAYAGHQFGQFNPLLGDGRATLIGELEVISAGSPETAGPRDIHLKGSGRTPYSRGGSDGRAAVGPMLREFLISEAMHAMGIPTTRSLAVILTGESVQRSVPEPGAVLVRVASSHLRVGSFQYARMMQQRSPELLQELADFALERHHATGSDSPLSDGDYLGLLREVCAKQARLVAQWMHVGFVHGVMNTDNITISGETIDYGPCAFLDSFNPHTWFSSIDQQGRYAFGRQPAIMLWDLERLAESLLPLIEEQLGTDTEGAVAAATEVLQEFPSMYRDVYTRTMLPALGFSTEDSASPSSEQFALCDEFVEWLNVAQPDQLSVLRSLATLAESKNLTVSASASGEKETSALPPAEWLQRWHDLNPDAALMRRTNPVRIPRNHLVEEALQAASNGDFEPFEELLAAVTDPFDSIGSEESGVEKKNNRVHDEKYARPAPEGFGPYTTFCGT